MIRVMSVTKTSATQRCAAENLLTIRQNRLTASATLIDALGGGWSTALLPEGTDPDKTTAGATATEAAAKQQS